MTLYYDPLFLILIIISFLILIPLIYLSGLIIKIKDNSIIKATFISLSIIVLDVIINELLGFYITILLGIIITTTIVKSLYKSAWKKALLMTIISYIFLSIIAGVIFIAFFIGLLVIEGPTTALQEAPGKSESLNCIGDDPVFERLVYSLGDEFGFHFSIKDKSVILSSISAEPSGDFSGDVDIKITENDNSNGIRIYGKPGGIPQLGTNFTNGRLNISYQRNNELKSFELICSGEVWRYG